MVFSDLVTGHGFAICIRRVVCPAVVRARVGDVVSGCVRFRAEPVPGVAGGKGAVAGAGVSAAAQVP